jgi:membrane fusion protein (multidrug efflux system)
MKFAKRINTANRRDDMEEIKDAPTLQLILADGTVYAHPGKILYTDRQVDITTGTIRVASSFPNPENILRPGQFGRIRAATETVNGALLVPQKAVNELQGMYQIAVVGDGNKVSIRSVKVGDRSGENWIIQDGVKPGEMVIVEGLQKVRDGSLVKPKQQTAPASGAAGAPSGTAKGA